MNRTARPLLAIVVLCAAVGFASPAVRAASPSAITDFSDLIPMEDVDEGPSYLREGVRTGANFWIDTVSTRDGRLLRLFSDSATGDPGRVAMDVGRFATVLTVGFEYATDLLTLEVTDSVLDAGQVAMPGEGGAVINSLGYFSSPSVRFSIRPVTMLSVAVDGSYAWGSALGDAGASHQLATAGLHVVFEPSSECFGVHPHWEIAVGARFAWAKVDTDPGVEAMALLVGGRATAILPLGPEVAFTVGVGAYMGLDPADFGGFDAGAPARHLNLEWSAGLRWFPLGG